MTNDTNIYIPRLIRQFVGFVVESNEKWHSNKGELNCRDKIVTIYDKYLLIGNKSIEKKKMDKLFNIKEII